MPRKKPTPKKPVSEQKKKVKRKSRDISGMLYGRKLAKQRKAELEHETQIKIRKLDGTDRAILKSLLPRIDVSHEAKLKVITLAKIYGLTLGDLERYLK